MSDVVVMSLMQAQPPGSLSPPGSPKSPRSPKSTGSPKKAL